MVKFDEKIDKKALFFDTLAYADGLQQAGVEHAGAHAKCLASALNQNIYSKRKVDHMLEDIIRQSEQRHQNMLAESREKFLEIENRLIKTINHYLVTTITVLGTLIIATGTIATFAHHLV